MKEIWKPIVIVGKEHRWYSVSNYGNLVSHLKSGTCVFDENITKEMTISKKITTIGRVRIYYPKQFVIDTEWDVDDKHTLSGSRNNYRKDLYIYQLVMWTFRPIDLYPPKGLENCWNQIPDDAKRWIRETITINHKDHNRFNNRLDNLEYCTPMHNTREAVKYYGGNLANKKIVDDFGVSSYEELVNNYNYGKSGCDLYSRSTVDGFF